MCLSLTFFLLFDLLHYAISFAASSIPSCICSLSVFTIKVLTHLFQVECLHKSFSFFLLPPIFIHSLRRSWVCLGGINPQTTTSRLLLFLSFFTLSFPSPHLSHPTFIVSVGCQHASVQGFIPQAVLWLSGRAILLVPVPGNLLVSTLFLTY